MAWSFESLKRWIQQEVDYIYETDYKFLQKKQDFKLPNNEKDLKKIIENPLNQSKSQLIK